MISILLNTTHLPRISMFFFVLACSSDKPLDLTSLNQIPVFEELIVVEKEKRRLSVYKNTQLVTYNGQPASWSIGLGDSPEGHKTSEGDEHTPEGLYAFSNHAPHSKYHGSLLIHYPNTEDARKALKNQTISPTQFQEIQQATKAQKPPPMNTGMGGYLLVHGAQKSTGLPPFSGNFDWTDGCIAMNNSDLDDLREIIKDPTGHILILP